MGDEGKTIALLDRLAVAVGNAGDGRLTNTVLKISKKMKQKMMTMEDVGPLARMLEGRQIRGIEAADVKMVIEMFRATARMLLMAQASDTAVIQSKGLDPKGLDPKGFDLKRIRSKRIWTITHH